VVWLVFWCGFLGEFGCFQAAFGLLFASFAMLINAFEGTGSKLCEPKPILH
jgi:hypothetical protein